MRGVKDRKKIQPVQQGPMLRNQLTNILIEKPSKVDKNYFIGLIGTDIISNAIR